MDRVRSSFTRFLHLTSGQLDSYNASTGLGWRVFWRFRSLKGINTGRVSNIKEELSV